MKILRIQNGEGASAHAQLSIPTWWALTASMISHHGKENAEAWLQAVKANLARKPQGNDRAQVKAIKKESATWQ